MRSCSTSKITYTKNTCIQAMTRTCIQIRGGGGGFIGIVNTLSRYYNASLVLWATMVSTIVALVMPWYSIGKNRAAVTLILFKSLVDAECMASLMPLPERLLHSWHISFAL